MMKESFSVIDNMFVMGMLEWNWLGALRNLIFFSYAQLLPTPSLHILSPIAYYLNETWK